MSVVEKVSIVPAVKRKHGKAWEEEAFPPIAGLRVCFPQFLTLLCNFMEYDSQLGNFNTDKKKRKRLSSKYILCSSGSNLISVKRKNKGTPVFWNKASWYFWRGPFQQWTMGPLQSYIMSPPHCHREVAAAETLGKCNDLNYALLVSRKFQAFYQFFSSIFKLPF